MRLVGQISTKGTLKGYISIATKEVIREANGAMKGLPIYVNKVKNESYIVVEVEEGGN